ncbi:MAG: TraG family conjugative transposon ATPase [Bacteroidales bacterium]
MAYGIELPEVYSLGADDFDNICSELFKFVKMLPECILHKQDIFLKSNYQCDNLENRTFLQKATYKHFYNRDYVRHYAFLFITLSNLKSFSKDYLSVNLIKSKKQFAVDHQKMENFNIDVNRAVNVLNDSGVISLKPLQDFELREILFNYINGFNQGKMTDIVFKPEFKIGDNFYNVYAVNNVHNLPESVNSSVRDNRMSADDFIFYKSFLQPIGLELDCNHIVNQYIFIDDHKELKKEISKKYNQFNMFSKFSPHNEHGAENLKDFLNDLEQDENIRLCRAHVNLIAWADSKKELSSIDNQVVTRFKEVDITPYFPKYIDHVYYFLSGCPGNAGSMPREETFISHLQGATCFLLVVSNYKSDDKGLIFNERMFNLPVLKDDFYGPYESKLITARNAIIVASTGRGKSVLLNHILRHSIENNFLLSLIDLGGSYEKLFHLYPEESAYIQYQEGVPLGINPFLIKSTNELTADKVRTLADAILILWKKEKKEEDSERISLYKIIKEFYSRGPSKLSFSSFYDYVKNEKSLLSRLEIDKEFFNKEEFLHNTGEYAHGMFSFLLEDKEQIRSTGHKRFVGFELENIKDNMDVLPLVFMMIRDYTENIIWGNKTADKRIWFEEAAKLIKYPIMLRIMDYYFQTIRKHNGSVGIVLQTIEQIPNNEIGNAILENTDIYYILKQDNIESISKRIRLTSHDTNQVLSIQNNFSTEPFYTEFLLKMGSYSNVYRLEIPLEARLAFLSESKDKKPIMDEFKRTGSMEKAIQNLTKIKHLCINT